MTILMTMVNRDKYQLDSLLVKVMDQDQKGVELIVVGTPYNKTNTATMLTMILETREILGSILEPARAGSSSYVCHELWG